MSLAIVLSRASIGIEAPLVTIEVHLGNGLPSFNLVGLGDAAVRESRDRVRSALLNSGFEFPAKRITVNLAPADLPKDGGRFDLAIAIGIIAASGLLPDTDFSNMEIAGELALSGEIRSVSGVLPFNFACQDAKRLAILPKENCAEAGLIANSKIIAVSTLTSLFLHLSGQQPLQLYQSQHRSTEPKYSVDISDIIGQASAKRALEIAAAGNHNLIFCGPPGTGKTMLAHRLMTILPDMTELQALETATVYSIVGNRPDPQTWCQRRFRQPHHTSSAVSLVGGGGNPMPGEISLAHHGVLFLDELPEFQRRALDVLREPLESGQVCISRARRQVTYPAQFQLVAAMNPSPTGSVDDGRSTPDQILKYLSRISGPFLDRMDLQVDVPKLTGNEFGDHQQRVSTVETSQQVKKRVCKAREIQLHRANKCNAQLTNKELQIHCGLSAADQYFLKNAVDKLGLSMRAYHRVIKVSRTLADLEVSAKIERSHLAEALGYRALDDIIRQLSV